MMRPSSFSIDYQNGDEFVPRFEHKLSSRNNQKRRMTRVTPSNRESMVFEDPDAKMRWLDAWTLIRERRGGFRRWIKRYLSFSPLGFYIDLGNIALSAASVIFYIAGTYNDDTADILSFVDGIFGLFFLIDYLLRLFIADSRSKFLVSPIAIIDIITIVPALVTVVGNPTGLGLIIELLVVLRVLRIVRINRFVLSYMDNEVNKKVAALITNLLTAVVFCSGIIFALENDYRRTYMEPLFMFHDVIYFVIVTISTVGYGDIYPMAWASKMLVVLLICAALVYIPKATNNLIQLMSHKSIYQRSRYRPTPNMSHVVIMGSLDPISASAFLTELFHEDHGNQDMHAVFLSEKDPGAAMENLIKQPQYITNVTWLTGSPMVISDIMRASILTANACFLLCNKFATNADQEDSSIILKALSIKRFVLQVTGKDISTSLQLMRLENKPHFTLSAAIMKQDLMRMDHFMGGGSVESMKDIDASDAYRMPTNGTSILAVNTRPSMHSIASSQTTKNIEMALVERASDPIVCVNEIKMNLLAQSCLCPGIITMIGNLVMSVDEPDEDDGETGDWLTEYHAGSSFEIYRTKLSKVFETIPFCTAAQIVHRHTGSMMFALEVSNHRGCSRMLLNPGTAKIPNLTDYEVYAFVLAEDMQKADFSNISVESNVGTTKYTGRSHVESHSGKFKPVTSSLAVQLEMCKENAKAKSSVETIPTSPKRGTKVAEGWGLIKKKMNREVPVTLAVPEVAAEENIEESTFYILPVPVPIEDVYVKSHLAIEFPEIRQHIVICGSVSGLSGLIKTLRAKHLAEVIPIVILHPNPPDMSLWANISVFPCIIFVQGSPTDQNDLNRAGVKYASRAIILASCGDHSGESESMTDAQAIFTHQGIIGLNSNIQVVTELISNSNVGFLDMGGNKAERSDKFNDRNRDEKNNLQFASKQIANAKYHNAVQFISGIIYSSSMLDTLTCQSFYNPHITSVFRALVGGEVLKVQPMGQVSSSSERFINSLPSSHLYQIPVPREMKGLSFGELFRHLSTENSMIPLGLYRGVESQFSKSFKGNPVPYVYTNPSQKTILGSKDLIFVLTLSTPNSKLLNKSIGDVMQELKVKTARLKGAKRDQGSTVTAGNKDPLTDEVKELREEVKQLHHSLNQIKEALGL